MQMCADKNRHSSLVFVTSSLTAADSVSRFFLMDFTPFEIWIPDYQSLGPRNPTGIVKAWFSLAPQSHPKEIGHLVFRSHANITPLCARTKWFLVGNSTTQVQMSLQKRPLVSPTKLQRLISLKWNHRVDSSSPACRPKSSKYSWFTFFKSSKNTHRVSSVKGKKMQGNQARPFYVKRLELMKISINDSSSGIHWSLEEKPWQKRTTKTCSDSQFSCYTRGYTPLFE